MQRNWSRIRSYWASLTRTATRRQAKAKLPQRDGRSLRCEPLEQRQLLSISPGVVSDSGSASGMIAPPVAIYGPISASTAASERILFLDLELIANANATSQMSQVMEDDTTPPVLLETSLVDGAQLTTGPIMIDARFSELLSESVLASDAVRITGQNSGEVEPDSISFDPETCLLTLEFDAPTEDLWTVTFLAPLSGESDGLQDLAGNTLAEEVSVWFTTEEDLGGTVLEGEFERLGPLGTGALSWDTSDTIHYATDRDSFLVNEASGLLLTGPFGVPGDELDALMLDQPTTLVVEPGETLQATIEVRDASGALIDSARAGEPGEAIYVTIPGLLSGQPYTITVGSLFGTMGEYVLSVGCDFALPEDGTLVVSTLDDVVDDNYSQGNFSLREAVQLANMFDAIDTITFDASLFGEPTTQASSDETMTTANDGFSGVVLNLTGGELLITSALTIEGPGAELLAIDAHKNSRIFCASLEDANTFAVSGLAMINGQAGRGGAIWSQGGSLSVYDSVFENNLAVNEGSVSDGGAIRAEGSVLTLINTSFIGNRASDDGGAIESGHGTSIVGCTFEDNLCYDNGGALSIHGGAVSIRDSIFRNNSGDVGGAVAIRHNSYSDNGIDELTVIDCLFQGNQAAQGTADGGAICVRDGRLIVVDSAFVENYSRDDGGAICAYHDQCFLEIYNSTFSGNRSDSSSGAILAAGNASLTIINSTIANNRNAQGGAFDTRGPLLVKNTISYNNTLLDGTNAGVGGTFLPGSTNNLIDDLGYSTGLDPATNLIGIDPMLLPLADNGGGLPTYALDLFSPAVNAGSGDAAIGPDGTSLAFDQRGQGYARIVGERVDIGAFEHQDPLPEIMPTIPGDANDDGRVDGSDVTVVACNWQTSGDEVGWSQGDFNGDHKVDGSDVTILAGNWNCWLDPYDKFIVTTLNDVVNPWDGQISLREAITFANEHTGPDTISFATHLTYGVDPSVGAVLSLTGGELLITSDMTIQGLGTELLTISGNQASRVFHLTEGVSVTIADLTIADGAYPIVTSNAVSTVAASDSEAILVDQSCDPNGDGGGLWGVNIEELNLIRTVFTNNSRDRGGAIYVSGGSVHILDSEFYNNSAVHIGGAIMTFSCDLTIEGSTIADNHSYTVSGLYTDNSNVAITNTTIVQNSATSNGAAVVFILGSSRSALVVNSTIAYNTNNSAAGAAGIYSSSARTTLYNTIVAENYGLADSPWDLEGSFCIDSTNNLIGGLGNATGIDTKKNLTGLLIHLEPLADNGGLTRTRALPEDSPAIDAGSNGVALGLDGLPLAYDQRGEGFDRIVGSIVDVGAFERQAS